MTKYANAAAAAAAAAADKKAGQAARDKAMKDAKDKALRTDKTKGPQLSKRGGHPPPRRGPNDVDKSASIRAELKKMRKNPPVSDPPAPKPRSVAFDPVTGIPPKGKQPPTKPMQPKGSYDPPRPTKPMQPKGSYDPPRPTKPMTTTPGDRSPAFPIFKGGYTPTPKKKPTGPMTPMPNEGIGPMGPRLDPRGPVKAAMAKGGKVSLSPMQPKGSYDPPRPTKPMTTTPGDRPISTAPSTPSTPADRSPTVPIRKGDSTPTAPSTPADRPPTVPIPSGGFKGGYTPTPTVPIPSGGFKGGYTPTPTKPTGPMTPMPIAMAKGGRVSLSPKAKKSSSVGNVRKFSHGGKIDGCAIRGKTNTKKF